MGKEEEQLVILLKKLEDLEKGNEQINNSLEELKNILLQEKEKSDTGVDEDGFYDVAEVARLLHLNKRTIQRYWRENIIQGEKEAKNGRVRFKKSVILDHIKNTIIPNQYGLKNRK